jgi:hypothetical protein
MTQDIRSAHTQQPDAERAAAELVAQLHGVDPLAISFFTSHLHDGAALSRALMRAFPEAAVIGCTTAGELTQDVSTHGTTSLLALGRGKVRRAKGALARFEGGVEAGVRAAVHELSHGLDIDLRAADSQHWVGVVLVEGLRMNEEAANTALGNAAPLLSFVGGSAGDNAEFVQTQVFCQAEASSNGAALLLLETEVPFVVSKTCSFVPQSQKFLVTRAQLHERVVYELDRRPALEVYAEALGIAPSALDSTVIS